jgi:hypothetical protein
MNYAVAVPAGAGTTTVNSKPCTLQAIIVTAAGTGTGAAMVYDDDDSQLLGEALAIGAVPATIGFGALPAVPIPALRGITVVNVANGPGLTIVYSVP